ncbi:MAG: hypothetical protein HYR55_02590 [Acidobacteria bacterium]|nr:hypothetical protein [Acidobacteriota bacterium]MBI3656482.1 hypothetical protein [Acidobacteriota bacterium]
MERKVASQRRGAGRVRAETGETVMYQAKPQASASPDKTARQRSPITILRDYLTSLTPEIIDRLSHMDELAMRAKIIAEYMQENSINDVNKGIRNFTAFERHRLLELGMIDNRGLRAIKLSSATPQFSSAGGQG